MKVIKGRLDTRHIIPKPGKPSTEGKESAEKDDKKDNEEKLADKDNVKSF